MSWLNLFSFSFISLISETIYSFTPSPFSSSLPFFPCPFPFHFPLCLSLLSTCFSFPVHFCSFPPSLLFSCLFTLSLPFTLYPYSLFFSLASFLHLCNLFLPLINTPFPSSLSLFLSTVPSFCFPFLSSSPFPRPFPFFSSFPLSPLPSTPSYTPTVFSLGWG